MFMIPDNELRAGCLIQDPKGDGYITLDAVNCDGSQLMVGGEGVNIEDLQGIAITEDLLEKCGFELIHGLSDPHYDLYKNGDFALNRAYKLAFKCSDQTCTIGEPLQYLHQLQNLYYDLCKEELKVAL
jgi:hypothetical protein